jgi:pimeloyl-ACP methyl ester carboxylesterase
MSELPNVVLVHGAWADGSSWSAVIRALQTKGYSVTAPQLAETSLADDVARVRHVLTRQAVPTIVAGHSWGGQVMTALGTDAPNVTGLVCLSMSAFEDVMGTPAWKSQPSWYLVAADDEAIPPDAERMFAQRMGAHTIEVPSGHLAMVSHPAEVVALIELAAGQGS